jgi:hypothetical protein
MLQQAHKLMESGQPREAAEMYDQLAQIAHSRNKPKPAAYLDVQAARAWAAAGDAQTAYERARRGLSAFITLGFGDRVAQILPTLVSKLRERGLSQAADDLERDLRAQLAQAGVSTATAPASPRGALPARCPHCNTPLNPAEIEWLNPTAAECPFCGRVVRTTR